MQFDTILKYFKNRYYNSSYHVKVTDDKTDVPNWRRKSEF